MLSAASTLSTIFAVASSPLVPHTAMSPAPIITGAPASASSLGGAPGGVGVGFLSCEQQSTSAGSATDHASVAAPRTKRERARDRGERRDSISASSPQKANPKVDVTRRWLRFVTSTFRFVPGFRNPNQSPAPAAECHPPGD